MGGALSRNPGRKGTQQNPTEKQDSNVEIEKQTTMGGALSRSPGSDGSQQNPMEKQEDHPLYKFDEIMKMAKKIPTAAEVRSSKEVFFDDKKMKYWVDGEYNCFMIFPRGLFITWSEDGRYWSWKNLLEPSYVGEHIEVVELLNVCWLEIHGKLELSPYLNPGVTYEVFFEIKLNENASGWNIEAVDLRLKLPQGSVQERKENLDRKPKNRWLLLKVGDFQPECVQNGEVVVSLFQYGNHWKRGIVIKGIVIIPKEGTYARTSMHENQGKDNASFEEFAEDQGFDGFEQQGFEEDLENSEDYASDLENSEDCSD